MDYSLLVGFHFRHYSDYSSPKQGNIIRKKIIYWIFIDIESQEWSNVNIITQGFILFYIFMKVFKDSLITSLKGGVISEDGSCIYYLGIIDILQVNF